MDTAVSSLVPRALGPHTAARRLLGSILAGLLVGSVAVICAASWGWAIHLVLGWDAAGLTLLASTWEQIHHETALQTRRHAAKDDPGRALVRVIVLLTSTASLFAAGYVMRNARHIAPSRTALCVLLAGCLIAVMSSWLLTHTAYTLRYAHLYYRDDAERGGGLDFPGKEEPDGYDFAYFSFTLGMCFQVSDVAVCSRQMRRTVLAHGLLSFLYNTVVLAVAVNLGMAFFN